ncbi:unnamed protein product [Spirodela intermedia]|uniref:Uncharacterized protein n=1 Tax=Spirodela intermedia TaxID=51605 RepID=A0A7I8I836_SPIIN|nr:unnamed protein product [Spirodela intermedia]CAA6653817.1 unnamed protein product [Spirodela intermedia]
MAEISSVRAPSFRLPSFRLPEASPLSDQEHLERRQLFLRSYLFSRERAEGDKRAGRRLAGLRRLRRLLCVKLRAARRLRRVLWQGSAVPAAASRPGAGGSPLDPVERRRPPLRLSPVDQPAAHARFVRRSACRTSSHCKTSWRGTTHLKVQ